MRLSSCLVFGVVCFAALILIQSFAAETYSQIDTLPGCSYRVSNCLDIAGVDFCMGIMDQEAAESARTEPVCQTILNDQVFHQNFGLDSEQKIVNGTSWNPTNLIIRYGEGTCDSIVEPQQSCESAIGGRATSYFKEDPLTTQQEPSRSKVVSGAAASLHDCIGSVPLLSYPRQ